MNCAAAIKSSRSCECFLQPDFSPAKYELLEKEHSPYTREIRKRSDRSALRCESPLASKLQDTTCLVQRNRWF